MNYYPYINMMSTPYMASAPIRTGLFSNIFKGFNFSSILNGTGKVLNVANQAIPLIKQAKPVINNAKTMFKVMNEFRNSDNTIKRNITNNTNNLNSTSNLNNTSNTNIIKNTSMPTFFQ